MRHARNRLIDWAQHLPAATSRRFLNTFVDAAPAGTEGRTRFEVDVIAAAIQPLTHDIAEPREVPPASPQQQQQPSQSRLALPRVNVVEPTLRPSSPVRGGGEDSSQHSSPTTSRGERVLPEWLRSRRGGHISAMSRSVRRADENTPSLPPRVVRPNILRRRVRQQQPQSPSLLEELGHQAVDDAFTFPEERRTTTPVRSLQDITNNVHVSSLSILLLLLLYLESFYNKCCLQGKYQLRFCFSQRRSLAGPITAQTADQRNYMGLCNYCCGMFTHAGGFNMRTCRQQQQHMTPVLDHVDNHIAVRVKLLMCLINVL